MRTSYCVALLAVFVISTSVLPTSLMADEIVPTPSTLNLNVSAEIEKSPDVALINASVVTLDKTAQESMTQNAQKMSAVFIQLKTLGIAEKYMQTSGINLFPQYSSNQSNPTKITGYQASNSLTIKVHDMNKVGDVIDQLIKVGINGDKYGG